MPPEVLCHRAGRDPRSAHPPRSWRSQACGTDRPVERCSVPDRSDVRAMYEHHIRRSSAIERFRSISRFAGDTLCCAIAIYRGSWERPNTMFANAVKATVVKGVVKGNAPNFAIFRDAYFDYGDIASDTLKPERDGAPTAPAVSSDDRERGWSIALFPAKPLQPDTTSVGMANHHRPAEISRSPVHVGAPPTRSNPWGDNLFVPRSAERRP
jgi:hypothetical protein